MQLSSQLEARSEMLSKGLTHKSQTKNFLGRLVVQAILTLSLVLVGLNAVVAQTCVVPTNATAGTITPTSAVINWNVAQNATSYEVNYIPLNAPSTIGWTTVAAPTNTATLTSLNTNTVYVAVVRSVCGAEFSDYTTKIVFSTQTCQPPNGLQFSNITQTSMNLQWNMMSGANSYKVLSRQVISDQNPGAWNVGTTANNNYSLTGLTANSLYAVRLMSDCGALSDTSSESLVSTGDCMVPNGLMVSGMTPSSLSLQWNAVNGATQYNIEYREMGVVVWNQVNSNTNSKTINSLSGNTQYEIRVRSRCSGNTLSDYNIPIIGYTLPCAMPVNAMVSNVGVSDATITWNNATGATQYKLDYREANNVAWTTVNANSTTKTLTNLTPNTNYQVRLRAKCSGNQYSAYTDTLVFSTKLCAPPAILNIDSTGYHYARLKWSSAQGATRYNLQYKAIGDSLWSQINVNNTLRGIGNLIPNQAHIARVRSQCGQGIYSNFSNEVIFSGYGCFTPINLTLDSTTYTTANLHWDFVSFATQYRIEYKPTQDTVWQTTQTQNTNININGLSEGTTYQFRMRSRCPQNEFSEYSDTLFFTTNGCEIPYNVYTDSMSLTAVTIGWEAIPSSQGYQVEYKPEMDSIWTRRNTSVPNKRISGLDPNVMYDFRIRNKCDQGVFSNYTENFKLLTGSCGMPSNISADSLNPTTARLNWTPDQNSTQFSIQYRVTGNPVWTTVNTANSTIDITGLDLIENDYEFKIAGECGNGGGLSLFSVFSIASSTTCNLEVGPETLSVCKGRSSLCLNITPKGGKKVIVKKITWYDDVNEVSLVTKCWTTNISTSKIYNVTIDAVEIINNGQIHCTIDKMIYVDVKEPPLLTLQCPTSVCQPGPISINFTCTGCPLNDRISYSFTTGNPPQSIPPIRGTLGSFPSPINIPINNGGFNTFTMTVTGANGCSVTRSCTTDITVFESPPAVPPITVAIDPSVVCLGGIGYRLTSPALPILPAGIRASWTITPLAGNSITPDLFTNNATACITTGSATVCLTYTLPNGCATQRCIPIGEITGVLIADYKNCKPNFVKMSVAPIPGATYRWFICGEDMSSVVVGGGTHGSTFAWDLDLLENFRSLADPGCLVSVQITVGPNTFTINTRLIDMGIVEFISVPNNLSTVKELFQLVDRNRDRLLEPSDVNGNIRPLYMILPSSLYTFDIQANRSDNADYRFQNVILEFRNYSRFSISSNADITMNNCHIHAKRNSELWEGIYIQPSSDQSTRFSLKNSCIEHAEKGTYISQNDGITQLQILSSCYNENRIHIGAEKMRTQVTWNISDSQLDCKKELKTSYFENALRTKFGMCFDDCGLVLTTNLPAIDNRLRILDIGYYAKDCSVPQPYSLSISNFVNSLTNFDHHNIGILIENTTKECSLAVGTDLLNTNTFTITGDNDLTSAVLLKGDRLKNVTFSKTKLINTGTNSHGIRLNNTGGVSNSSTIKLSNNQITGFFQGVSIEDVTISNVKIENNTIKNCRTGVWLSQNNTTDIPLISINNNIFTSTNALVNAIAISADRGIATPLSGSLTIINNRIGDVIVNMDNGSPAPNSSFRTGISIRGNFPTTISGNDIHLRNNTTQQGIVLANCGNALVIDNQISGNQLTNTNLDLDANSDAGIFLNGATDGSTISCNRIRRFTHAIEAKNAANLCTLQTNTFSTVGSGICISNGGIIGSQGDLSTSQFNAWNSATEPGGTFRTYARKGPGGNQTSDGTNQFIYTSSNAGSSPWLFDSPVVNNSSESGSQPFSSQVVTGDAATPSCTGNWFSLAKRKKVYALEEEYLATLPNIKGKMGKEVLYSIHQGILKRIQSSEELRKSSILGSLYHLPKYQNHVLSVALDELIVRNPQKASQINQMFQPSNYIEENQKRMNDLLIRMQLGVGNSEYTAQDIGFIKTLSEECPLKGGKSVFQARSLRSQFELEYIHYNNDCSSSPEDEMKELSAVNNPEMRITLSPNPANSIVFIHLYSEEIKEADIVVYSVTGLKVDSHPLQVNGETQYSTQNLAAGVYICCFKSNGVILGTQKLVITH